MDNAVAVASDEQGRMLPEALLEAIARARQRGLEPFMVNATAGTTVLGAYDPLEELADVCEREGLWLHVDVSCVVCVRVRMGCKGWGEEVVPVQLCVRQSEH